MAEWKDKNGVLCVGLRVDPKANKANKGGKKSEQGETPEQGVKPEQSEQGGNENE
jgi:hypothetical protein|nr:MAG TPA: hypothetical protein [Bacteriophage sp.]